VEEEEEIKTYMLNFGVAFCGVTLKPNFVRVDKFKKKTRKNGKQTTQ
jgi:hypothetical protein